MLHATTRGPQRPVRGPRGPHTHRGMAPPHRLQPLVSTSAFQDELETPRSERMMERLRDGLHEYIRLYNPVSTNWRRMNKFPTRSRRHSADVQPKEKNVPSRTGESADLVAPLIGENGVPKLHILHSDSESEVEGVGDFKGSVRSMPNLTYRPPLLASQSEYSLSNVTSHMSDRFSPENFQLPTDRFNLSTISSDEEDGFTSRRESMRLSLNLMGSKKGKKGQSTPRIIRLRKPKPSPAYSGHSDSDVTQDDTSFTETFSDLTSRIARRQSRVSLGVITERQNTEDDIDNHSGNFSPSKQSVVTAKGGEENASVATGEGFVAGKRGSRVSLKRNSSRYSMESDPDMLAQSLGSHVLSKRNSVAQLRARRRRQMLGQKFKRVCKLFIVLNRLWKSHSANVAKVLDNFESLDAVLVPDGKERQLLFDLSMFKSSDEARIPVEAKKILQMKPSIRTPEELKYLQTALRNYPVIAEYPVHMQALIAERAWFEGYDVKRVMVREGHKPQNFYFILSGSVVVSRYDPKTDTNKTRCFMGRGDAFGELAIVNRTTRDSTVITKEAAQFLVLRDEDFLEIFSSGGLSNPKDPFLTSLWYLKGWPLKLLGENPKKAVYSFFRRGFVLAPNTNESQWIYIVKSGSLSVFKKLKFESPDATKPRKVNLKKKPKLEMLYEAHEGNLQYNFDRQISNLDHSHQLNRLKMQPNELNIHINPNEVVYRKSDEIKEEEDPINLEKESTTLSRSVFTRERSTVSLTNTTATSKRKKVTFSMTGPILTKTNMEPNPPAASEPLKEVDPNRIAVMSGSQTRYDQADLSYEFEQVPRHKLPMFVTVQTLTKGSYFGLNALVYKTQKQPVFSLVSNGAEVIMIDKRFFEDNCSQRLLTDMRESIYPFPMDDVLQDMLKRSINWDHNCRDVFTSTLHNVKTRKANIHDARSMLLLDKPPEMPPRPS